MKIDRIKQLMRRNILNWSKQLTAKIISYYLMQLMLKSNLKYTEAITVTDAQNYTISLALALIKSQNH